jgi:tRNA(Ile)-lysidine synthase
MNLTEKARGTINKYKMLSENDHVLIALSGGPDSVCLAIVLNELKKEYNLSLKAIYLDHGLRPSEVENEKAFCREFCNSREIGFSVEWIHVKEYADKKGLNLQEAARELRYSALDKILLSSNADRIALGHNADDQAETVLMRLFRGSGRKGLTGIPPVRGKIIRPLIEVERKDIERFLQAGDSQSFMIDSSNLKEEYNRNWLRNNVITEVKKKNPSVVEDICRSIDIIREEDEYLEFIVTKTLMRLISRKTDTAIELFITPLETIEKPVLRRVLRRAVDATESLRRISFANIENMIHLINKGNAGDSIDLPGDIRVIRDYSILKITTERHISVGAHELGPEDEISLSEVEMKITSSIESAPGEGGDNKYIVLVDAENLEFPLSVGPREEGDFFYPIGFGKRKKLQDFFVDEKISRYKRDEVPIVKSGNDIIWVAGLRADHRYRVTENTKNVLRLKITKIKADVHRRKL